MKSSIIRAARIDVQIATARRGIPHSRSLRAWAGAALPQGGGALCIRVVDTQESRKLNRRWRAQDKPTNVLSFPHAESLIRSPRGPARSGPLGDMVICAPVVAREAREQGKPLAAHWAHMVVHGVLHLQGYDHVKNRDAKRMEAREVEILAQFGYQDPYVFPKGRS